MASRQTQRDNASSIPEVGLRALAQILAARLAGDGKAINDTTASSNVRPGVQNGPINSSAGQGVANYITGQPP